jgi:hypothetical protein
MVVDFILAADICDASAGESSSAMAVSVIALARQSVELGMTVEHP